jgi:nucleoside-diphosphate-sugar epimerase
LLIVGCGDIGLRVLRLLSPRVKLFALTSSDQRVDELRSAGAVPVVGNLDQAHSLAALARCVRQVDGLLHLAPPQNSGTSDQRTRQLLQLLERGGRLKRLVYASTSGVYGDCSGDWVSESRPVAPATERAQRRVDAEARLRHFGLRRGVTVSVLRVPGIYAADRPGGHPRDRLLRGTPVLLQDEDVYTNHIHADDLARACVLALFRAHPQRVYHVSDNTELRMGDYFDLAADLCAMPRPPRVSRSQAEHDISPMGLSFMSESRRLHNRRLTSELRLQLRYPTVTEGLAEQIQEGPGMFTRL